MKLQFDTPIPRNQECVTIILMIYMIGGPPRAGKSLLAQKLISKKPMSSFSCDFMYNLDQIRNIPDFEHMEIIEKGNAFLPSLESLLINIARQTENCLIEGEVILPHHIYELSKKYEIRACFLGLSDTSIEQIISNGGFFNWPKYKIQNNMKHEIVGLAERTISRSKIIQDECQKYDQQFFDLALGYESQQNVALTYLLS